MGTEGSPRIGSGSGNQPPGGVLCLVEYPYPTKTPTFPSLHVPGPTSRMYELAFKGIIGSGAGGSNSVAREAVARLHTRLGTGIFSGCLDNVSMVQGTEDRLSVCSERAVCPALLTLGADRSGPSIVRKLAS